jgi:lactate racemase
MQKEIDRSNLITYVDNPDQKYLFHYGDGFLYDRLPKGTRVIYPPPPLAPISNPDGAIEHAIENPLGADPLSAKLRPGMKVTIAFDDLSLPLPPMERPDIRQRVIGILLKKLGDAGIDDIHLIAALGLHRRMTPAELKERLGAKIFNQFHPDRLYNHDAEDRENLAFLGKTEMGEEVEINGRIAESDLLLYVNLNLVSMDGGYKSLPTGICSYRSIRHHHNTHTLMHSRSYMDPPKSALHHSCHRIWKVITEHVNFFTIETTLNSATFPKLFPYLETHEKDYSILDKINFGINKTSLGIMPPAMGRAIMQSMRAPYGLTGVNAGHTEPVHERTLENLYKQQLVPVKGQSDILITGVPYLGPYNVNSIMNPILVMCMSLGYTFNFYRNAPLVRKGGVAIFTHPVDYDFHKVHHPSYIDFFEQVLTETTDSAEMEARFEESFAHNPKYINLYRNSYAYHGVHPFYMWYWGCYALDYLGKVIFVKPRNARSVEAIRRMGFDHAKNLSEAIEMAQSFVGGGSPEITYYHYPPIFMCDVTP